MVLVDASTVAFFISLVFLSLLICDNAYMNGRRDGQKPSRGQYGVGRRGVGTPDGAEGPSQPDRTVQDPVRKRQDLFAFRPAGESA